MRATALAGIRRLVEEAQTSRSRAQALADRAAAALFYFAAAAGVLTFVVWMVIGDAQEAIERTVTVLVIACPHALGLAIPLVIAISTATAAKAGILVKDRLALERMRQVDTVLFDKTGTLTKGTPAVTDVVVAGGGLAGRGAGARGCGGGRQRAPAGPGDRRRGRRPDQRCRRPPASPRCPGTGWSPMSTVTGSWSAVPARSWTPRRRTRRCAPRAERWAGEGSTVLYVQRNGQVVGALALADEVRPESAEAVRQLHATGVRVAMITGDARSVADAVAAQLGRGRGVRRGAARRQGPEGRRSCRPAVTGWPWSATA